MVSFIIRVGKIAFTLVCLSVIKVLANTTFTVIPSSNVEVNQVVILQCIVLNQNPNIPLVVYFGESQSASICQLDPYNGTCKNNTGSCSFIYNATCLNNSEFNVQVAVPRKWNGMNMRCSTFDSENGISNAVTFFVKVPVTFVTLTLATTNVLAGQEINMSCITSYCDPPANITWFTTSIDSTNQYTYTNNTTADGLVRTKSSLQRIATTNDNGMMVFCSASNIPSQSVNSTAQIITVSYKPKVELSTPNQYSVTEGQQASMECKIIAANPNISIIWEWFKTTSPNDKLSNGPNLMIPNITRDRSGSYSCTARNSVGISDAVTINLDVLYKPKVVLSTPNQYSVTEGQQASMQCKIIAANPNISIIWEWFKTTSPNDKLSYGPNLMIPNITRDRSGSYSCTARNSVGPSDAVTINLDVLYKPKVVISTPNPYIVTEGQEAKMQCRMTAANPNTSIEWKWFKTTSPNDKLSNGPNLMIPNITRNRSGSYSCTARNSIGPSDAVTINLDVQYKPTIRVNKFSIRVNESDKVMIIGEIDSNPLADVDWYSESVLLKNEFSVKNTTYSKDNAMCTDTKNFTIVASNTVERNVSAVVELIVNCKPQIHDKNITLGVTDTTGIEFSVTAIAYPEPDYEVRYENGTENDQIMASLTRNAVNNFTIRVNHTDVKNSDYGVYLLVLRNSYGNATTYINVIPQRTPDMPIITDFKCEVKTARIQWESSFNGGDPQTFTVVALHGNQIENKTDTISDKGKNEILTTFVQNLQSSTTYVFSVAAHNKHGFSLSKNISCTTLKEEEGVNLPSIAGGAVAGGTTLAIIVIVIVFMFRRYTKNEKQAGKPQRLEDELGENQDTDDDGLKENILYVSADKRDIDKPESAVYAAVNKKSQESNNNANVYAEVNKSEPKIREAAHYSDVKPKKGFFKKNEQDKVGSKPKKSKGRKQKIKQEIADVYENSEGFAMTANVDNVYSNSEHKNQSETEQRGYKNKDGLLYVEVNFDGKQGQDNPVIHGEDEKTDYATVEFPMPSALHKASGSEEL